MPTTDGVPLGRAVRFPAMENVVLPPLGPLRILVELPAPQVVGRLALRPPSPPILTSFTPGTSQPVRQVLRLVWASAGGSSSRAGAMASPMEMEMEMEKAVRGVAISRKAAAMVLGSGSLGALPQSPASVGSPRGR